MIFLDSREYILSKFPDEAFNANGQIHTNCPFHDDNSPSFSIRDSGLFVCGSPRCGVKGSFAYFYKLMEGIESWAQVYKDLKITQVTPDIEALLGEKTERKKQYWISTFPLESQREPIKSVKYLIDRGIGSEVVERFGLLYGCQGDAAGISVEDAIIAPVYDLNGAYITFQVRYLSPNTKKRWKMPSGSPAQNLLYGGWLIGDFSSDLWIVEGASDVWNLAKLGEQAVGLFTAKATAAQLNRIHDICIRYQLKPIVCMDGDAVYLHHKTHKYIDCGKDIYNELIVMNLNASVVYLNKKEDPGMFSADRLKELKKIAEEL